MARVVRVAIPFVVVEAIEGYAALVRVLVGHGGEAHDAALSARGSGRGLEQGEEVVGERKVTCTMFGCFAHFRTWVKGCGTICTILSSQCGRSSSIRGMRHIAR